MKREKIANLMMVFVIFGMLVTGILVAFSLKAKTSAELGARFHRKAITETVGQGQNVCTVSIVCNTVLDHLEKIKPEKIPYLPKNGTILPSVSIRFAVGDSALQVLQTACQAAEIPVEVSGSALYGSTYIEGIGHLYEFDCGAKSGWMYQVNGEFPNYGCSEYLLQDGDEIIWCYTCDGWGEDVGGRWTEEP